MSSTTLQCAACGSATLHACLFVVNQCRIWRCTACGLGHADVNHFDPETYYTDDYFSGKHTDGYADYRGSERVLRREFANSLSFVRKFRQGGRLLDIGCAYGFFLKEAQRHFEVAGIEIAEHAAQTCREAGLSVLSGMADAANLASVGNFDVITLFDVIEHLPKPDQTLALCGDRLLPGGVVVISTGDFGSIAARLFGARWRLMTPPQHLWFFTRESIRRMAAALGLFLIHHDHPAKIVPASLITFQLRRMLGLPHSRRRPKGQIGIPVNLYDAMRVVLRKGDSSSQA
jgi:2-polyprenyl-3-methyl-5-hydroxy-6-metoxy-1,4-benzoquinol methylase